MLSRSQQARWAAYLARPQLVLFFVGVMGAAVVVNFGLTIAVIFRPQMSVGFTPWIFMGAGAINLATLTARAQVLKHGWLPVSVADVGQGPLQEAWGVPDRARTLLERVRERGWLQWKDVYDVLPDEEAEVWLRTFQRWRPGKDRVADRSHMRRLAPPVARRAEQGDHVGEQVRVERVRARVRT